MSLPNELWLEVFGQVDRGLLYNISLASRAFSRLTRSLRFESFRFRPYAFRNSDEAILLPSSEEIDVSMARLQFWLSDEIAPLVRSCHLWPWVPGHPNGPAWTFYPTDIPYMLLDLFLDQLSRFTSLNRLSAQSIIFQRTAMAAFRRVPSLKHLDIGDCRLQGDAEIGTCGTRHNLLSFSLSENVTWHAGAMPLWLQGLDSDRLVELTLHCNLRLWTANLDNIPTFSCLRSLIIDLDFSVMDANMSLLSKFPALEFLSIQGEDEDMEAPRWRPSDSTAWLALKSFSGPHKLFNNCIRICLAVAVSIEKSHLIGDF